MHAFVCMYMEEYERVREREIIYVCINNKTNIYFISMCIYYKYVLWILNNEEEKGEINNNDACFFYYIFYLNLF